MDFGNHVLHMNQRVAIPLVPTTNGHLSFHFVPNSTFYPEECKALAIEMGPDSWTNERLMKVHTQLGHIDAPGLLRLLKMANISAHKSKVGDAVQSCACLRAGMSPRAPIVNRHVATSPGTTIAMDAFYPTKSHHSQEFPDISRICGFTKFVMCRFIPSIRHRAIGVFNISIEFDHGGAKNHLNWSRHSFLRYRIQLDVVSVWRVIGNFSNEIPLSIGIG